jgi:hypothetical protein
MELVRKKLLEMGCREETIPTFINHLMTYPDISHHPIFTDNEFNDLMSLIIQEKRNDKINLVLKTKN